MSNKLKTVINKTLNNGLIDEILTHEEQATLAAAPELLEALKAMTEVNNKYKTVNDFKDDELEAHRKGILAIKKATE